MLFETEAVKVRSILIGRLTKQRILANQVSAKEAGRQENIVLVQSISGQ